jgi:hypothetical protein
VLILCAALWIATAIPDVGFSLACFS